MPGLTDRNAPRCRITIGSNDVMQAYDLPNAPDRLGRLVDVIFDTVPTVRIMVGSIPPCRDDSDELRALAYNATIPGVVAERQAKGKNVSFVDLYPSVPAGDLADRVHPDEFGYTKLGWAWYEAARRR